MGPSVFLSDRRLAIVFCLCLSSAPADVTSQLSKQKGSGAKSKNSRVEEKRQW